MPYVTHLLFSRGRRAAHVLPNCRGTPEPPFQMSLPGQENARPPGAYIPPPLRDGGAEGAPPIPAAPRDLQAPPPPDCRLVVIMMAITQQDKWVLSQGRLESGGFYFVCSLRGCSYIVTP